MSTFCKRLALLGVRSVLSVSKPRGLGSSYGLTDCRLFPYRKFSEFTKYSNPSKISQMETLQDSSPELINYRDQFVFRRMTEELRPEVEKIRAEVDKLRAEVEKKRTKAGLFDLRPLGPSYDFNKYSNPSKNSLEHHSTVSCPELEELQKVRAELKELEEMRHAYQYDLDIYTHYNKVPLNRNRHHQYDMGIYTHYSKELNECCKEASTSIRGSSAELRDTSSEFPIFGTAILLALW